MGFLSWFCYCILVCPVFYTFAFFPDFFPQVCFTILYSIMTLELFYDDLLFFFYPYQFSLPVQSTSKKCQVMLNHNLWLQLPLFYLFERKRVFKSNLFICFQPKYNLFFLCRWWCGTYFRLFQQWAVSIKLGSFIGKEWKNMGLIPPHQSNPQSCQATRRSELWPSRPKDQFLNWADRYVLNTW